MQLFSEDYLMHYGVKGMKWKKKKFGPGDGRPEDTNKGTEPGHFGLEKSDDFNPLKQVPTAQDKAYAKQRADRMAQKARIRTVKQRAAQHYKEDVGRSLQRAKKSRGFSATDESKGTASYVHATHDDVGGSRHLKYYKRKNGSYAPHR